jgi:hypothetical protein
MDPVRTHYSQIDFVTCNTNGKIAIRRSCAVEKVVVASGARVNVSEPLFRVGGCIHLHDAVAFDHEGGRTRKPACGLVPFSFKVGTEVVALFCLLTTTPETAVAIFLCKRYGAKMVVVRPCGASHAVRNFAADVKVVGGIAKVSV